ncbi:glycosyltransferase [Populibacterium corticicola]|uniref:D-inositol 3-phosphate glycosyltransferase n=2 Tax=Populibacterium corticicola TaxID=1812826 RepID=A0ABW5X9I0_9MICO
MVTDYYLPSLGGVQTAVKAAKESLESLGHEVTIFCPRFEPSTDDSVVALPASPIFKPDGYPFTWPYAHTYELMKAEFMRRQIDVVHVHSEMFAALAGLQAARDLSIPSVQTMHGRVDVYSASVLPLPSVSTALLARMHGARIPHTLAPSTDTRYNRGRVARRMWRLMINQANFADHVVVPSAHFAQKLVDQGVSRPVSIISNGLEDSALRRVGNSQPRVLSPDEPLRIMWCGRVSPEKRPDIFLTALSQMTSNFVANLYGEGVAFAPTKRLVHRLGLDDRVTMHGPVPQEDVLAAMQTHHVFVSSSYDFDNQPMVLLEAMASLLPAVVSDPDLLEMFPDGTATAAFGPDAAGLAAALDSLCADPIQVEQMSKALLNASEAVSQNTHVRALLDVYEGLL